MRRAKRNVERSDAWLGHSPTRPATCARERRWDSVPGYVLSRLRHVLATTSESTILDHARLRRVLEPAVRDRRRSPSAPPRCPAETADARSSASSRSSRKMLRTVGLCSPVSFMYRRSMCSTASFTSPTSMLRTNRFSRYPPRRELILSRIARSRLRAAHEAVLDEHVANAAAHLAAERHAAVAVLHRAAADDDVLARRVQPPAVGVAAALDRDAVVARVERAVLDEHVAARLGIAAVVVGPVAVDRHAADGDVLAQHGMDLPHRRADDRHAFDEHVLAAIGLDEVRRAGGSRRRRFAARGGHAVVGHLDEPARCRRRRRRVFQAHQFSFDAWPSSVPSPVTAMFSWSSA